MLPENAKTGDGVTVICHDYRPGKILDIRTHTLAVLCEDGVEIVVPHSDVYSREAGAVLQRTLHDLAQAQTLKARGDILRRFAFDWNRAIGVLAHA